MTSLPIETRESTWGEQNIRTALRYGESCSLALAPGGTRWAGDSDDPGRRVATFHAMAVSRARRLPLARSLAAFVHATPRCVLLAAHFLGTTHKYSTYSTALICTWSTTREATGDGRRGGER